MIDQPTCGTCSFVHKTNAANYCRRFPPQGHPLWVHQPRPAVMAPNQRPQKPDLTVETTFPFVNLDWWCGEHPVIQANVKLKGVPR